jgi:hypothetical protein
MSIKTLETEIAKLRRQFHALNAAHLRQKKYVALLETDEEIIGELADQIHRLHVTRNVMVAARIARRK